MNHSERIKLSEKLNKMIADFDDAQSKQDQRKHQVGRGNFIRRRKNEKDQLFLYV